MARQQKLKVFRTPIGFHDAYVAAPSRKAALEAWGSDRDLFGRGVAEQVTDEALMREPLAHPGTVIKLSRGTMAQQLAALPDDPPPPSAKPDATSSRAGSDDRVKPEKKASKPKPKPDRGPLDRAREALDAAEAGFEAERTDFKRRADDLARERAEMEKREKAERDKLDRALDKADAEYRQRMRAWRG
ncbi:hypothetical protein ASG11_05420 [Sphingomonas sp. Leaf357]|uniref:hypothetical protein n=1 Tax=Sphingomonas sp. Leaf357 TaxID=1736350 RepID=UPI0007002A88|nr:hypothetical protein [Sphingomonas sp. Leaf357]KQS05186.1 hypothetical protein ASG11_05420 [Sphingomonas sp. Leaf357]